MSARIPARRPPTRPLSCHVCGSTDVAVTESQQMLRVRTNVVETGGGRPPRRRTARRLHADARCQNPACRHRFWSRHPDALARSRAKDAAADG